MRAVIQKHGLTFISPSAESKRWPETIIHKENIETARRLAAEGDAPCRYGRAKARFSKPRRRSRAFAFAR